MIYTIWHLSTLQSLPLSLNICLGHVFPLHLSIKSTKLPTCHLCNIISHPSVSSNLSPPSRICLSDIAPISHSPHPSSYSLFPTIIPLAQVHPLSPLDCEYHMWSQCCLGVFGDMTEARNSNFPQRLSNGIWRVLWGNAENDKSHVVIYSSEHFQNNLWLCLWDWCKMYFEKPCQSLQKIRFHIVIKMNFPSVSV